MVGAAPPLLACIAKRIVTSPVVVPAGSEHVVDVELFDAPVLVERKAMAMATRATPVR